MTKERSYSKETYLREDNMNDRRNNKKQHTKYTADEIWGHHTMAAEDN